MDVELVARLRGVIGRLARQLNDTPTGEGLTPTQYSVLGLVRGRGPLGLAELAGLEGLNPTMLSRVVRVLDDSGLIRRLPDPSDLRAARVQITPDGELVRGPEPRAARAFPGHRRDPEPIPQTPVQKSPGIPGHARC